jgi:hypothetical protein
MAAHGLTRYPDANSSVARQAYFEVVFEGGGEARVRLMAV